VGLHVDTTAYVFWFVLCLIAAFAELQTEVIDFTSDLNVIGIPFWDYQTYTFKVLFPSHSNHPVFHGNVCQVCL